MRTENHAGNRGDGLFVCQRKWIEWGDDVKTPHTAIIFREKWADELKIVSSEWSAVNNVIKDGECNVYPVKNHHSKV